MMKPTGKDSLCREEGEQRENGQIHLPCRIQTQSLRCQAKRGRVPQPNNEEVRIYLLPFLDQTHAMYTEGVV